MFDDILKSSCRTKPDLSIIESPDITVGSSRGEIRNPGSGESVTLRMGPGYSTQINISHFN